MRPIDADRFKEYITVSEDVLDLFKTEEFKQLTVSTMEAIIKDIDEQPTIDAVEVVRCKDCKLTETDGTEVLWCEKMFDLHGFCEEVKPNHYCGYGKRKEETDG